MSAASSESSPSSPYAEHVRITVKQNTFMVEVHPTSQVRQQATLLRKNAQICNDFMDFHEFVQRPYKILGPCNSVTHKNLIELFNLVVQNGQLDAAPTQKFEDPQSGLVFRFLQEESLHPISSSPQLLDPRSLESTRVLFVCPFKYHRINVSYEKANKEERRYLQKFLEDPEVLSSIRRFSAATRRHFVVTGPCMMIHSASLARLFSLASAGYLARQKEGSVLDTQTKLALHFIPHEIYEVMDKNIKDLALCEQLWGEYKALAEEKPFGLITLSPIVLNLLCPALASRYMITLAGSHFLKIHHALEAFRSGRSFADESIELHLYSPEEDEFRVSKRLTQIVPEAAACMLAIQATLHQHLEPKLSSFFSSVTEKTIYDVARSGAFSKEALSEALKMPSN